jgi:sulfoxide reductase heme-binding subunit YedZ
VKIVRPSEWTAAYRHLWVIAIGAAVVWAFWVSRPEWAAMHRWNRAFADASVILIALALAIGPLARFLRTARRWLPWRRELGIHGVLLALIHTVLVLDGWVEWDLLRMLGFAQVPGRDLYVMVLHGFGFGNVVGVLAIGYGAVLAITSNDKSQRLLGGPTWKFVQRGAYVLWSLIVLHTGYFLYLNFLDFHRRTPEPNWLQLPFAALVLTVLALQTSASWRVWRSQQRPQRPGKQVQESQV